MNVHSDTLVVSARSSEPQGACEALSEGQVANGRLELQDWNSLPLPALHCVLRHSAFVDWHNLRLLSKLWLDAVDSEVTTLAAADLHKPRTKGLNWPRNLTTRMPNLRALQLPYGFFQSNAVSTLLEIAYLEDLALEDLQAIPMILGMTSPLERKQRASLAIRLTRLDLAFHMVPPQLQPPHHLPMEATDEWRNLRSLRLSLLRSDHMPHPALMAPLKDSLTALDLTYHYHCEQVMEAVDVLKIWGLKDLRLYDVYNTPLMYSRLAKLTNLERLDTSAGDCQPGGVGELNHLTKMTELNISGRYSPMDPGLTMLTALTGVLRLNVGCHSLKTTDLLDILTANFPNLQHLDCSGYMQLEVDQSFSRLTALTSLSAAGGYRHSDLASLSQLRALRLRSPSPADMAAIAAMSRLTHFSPLEAAESIDQLVRDRALAEGWPVLRERVDLWV